MMSKAEQELRSWLNWYATGVLSYDAAQVRSLEQQLAKMQEGR